MPIANLHFGVSVDVVVAPSSQTTSKSFTTKKACDKKQAQNNHRKSFAVAPADGFGEIEKAFAVSNPPNERGFLSGIGPPKIYVSPPCCLKSVAATDIRNHLLPSVVRICVELCLIRQISSDSRIQLRFRDLGTSWLNQWRACSV
ncbi:hypothetical protein EGR_10842 [Echinococcus granulosus]|uniref:Uncharacterized protein n=1 Tax=Echinococcus granulosus TaxID=6210 RepID=W6U1C4_ECHGR|nr:hypothetical protein EGR_10842 [Echinococcus granulosus]EUB54301.1 hypothetical protein EGR_10842 [Echinococcus granulosus]